MNGVINEYIDKYLQTIIEAKINLQGDKTLQKAQSRVSNHVQNRLNNGDEEVINLMKTLGLSSDLTNDEFNKKRGEYYQNGEITNQFNDEIKEVIHILQKYVNKGNSKFDDKSLKRDFPKSFDMIMRIKNFIDLKGLTYTYDKNCNMPSYPYGIDWKKGGDENDLDFNQFTQGQITDYQTGVRKGWDDEQTLSYMKEQAVNKYMELKFGKSDGVPNIVMANGNSKLPENILIVNFTSAINCPAWNECLVKHACYARQGEKGKSNIFSANENRSLFWKLTQNDAELLKLLMSYVQTYCFKYGKIAKHIKQNKIVIDDDYRHLLKNPMDLADKMSQLPLSHPFYTDEIIEIMKQYKRVDYIRLNENGDFIGQWLVDAWEKEASMYSKFDIKVSAYTCRHLDFNNMKNLILNVSHTSDSGNIARHFYALPREIYDALDETYSGTNNSLILDSDNKLIPNPQPLYLNNKITNKKYYKCPCGRNLGNNKVDCYQCKFCYEPKSDINENVIVFVGAHGGGKEQLNGVDIQTAKSIGVSKNFFKNLEKQNLMVSENTSINEMVSDGLSSASNMGVNIVTNNAINSMNKHFTELSSSGGDMTLDSLTESIIKSLIKDGIKKVK